jgi:hypothetical protein|eukprot:COSAG01_NODE_2868_length_6946_cov_9.537024_8_plen_109_part_00
MAKLCVLQAARDLADSLSNGVPIGAIDQSYGGTSIQFWMSSDAIKASEAPRATQCCGQNGGPSCLWNTQIYPYTIGPTQLSGVLWCTYQQHAARLHVPIHVVLSIYFH